MPIESWKSAGIENRDTADSFLARARAEGNATDNAKFITIIACVLILIFRFVQIKNKYWIFCYEHVCIVAFCHDPDAKFA